MNERITLQIGTAEELRAFAKDINSGRYHGQPDLTVKLTADIDLGGVVGAAEGAKITHCVFDGSIQILGDTGYYIDAGSIVGNVRGRITVSDCLNRGTVDANDYDFTFLTLGDIVGRWEGEDAELQPFSRDTLRRTVTSMEGGTVT